MLTHYYNRFFVRCNFAISDNLVTDSSAICIHDLRIQHPNSNYTLSASIGTDLKEKTISETENFFERVEKTKAVQQQLKVRALWSHATPRQLTASLSDVRLQELHVADNVKGRASTGDRCIYLQNLFPEKVNQPRVGFAREASFILQVTAPRN